MSLEDIGEAPTAHEDASKTVTSANVNPQLKEAKSLKLESKSTRLTAPDDKVPAKDPTLANSHETGKDAEGTVTSEKEP